MKRLAFLFLIVAIALMLGGNALAQNDGGETAKCSNETFHGDYGFTVNGTILVPTGNAAAPTLVVYIQGVQMMHADGKGNLTDNEALILNGVPLVDNPPSYFSLHTGTYKLDSNCTGLAFLSNQSEGGHNFIWLSFVVDKRGKQVRMVGVPPYDSGGIPRTVTSVGERVD